MSGTKQSQNFVVTISVKLKIGHVLNDTTCISDRFPENITTRGILQVYLD